MSYLYPYGDTQQLNLSWFLAKFKELYDYITNLDPDDIALATVLSRFTNEYNSSTNYIPGDYVIHEGFIYKANRSTTGNFNLQAWDATLPVNDIQGLRILLGGISTDLTDLEQNAVTNLQYTPGAASADGLLRQTKNGAAETVMTVDNEPTANSQNPVKSGAVRAELNAISDAVTDEQNQIDDLNDITGDGSLSGFTATDLTGAANELKGSINSVEKYMAFIINGNKSTTAIPLAQYAIVKNSTITNITDGLYIVAKAIPANTAIDSTYLTAVTSGGFNSIRNATYGQATRDPTNTTAGTVAYFIQNGIVYMQGYVNVANRTFEYADIIATNMPKPAGDVFVLCVDANTSGVVPLFLEKSTQTLKTVTGFPSAGHYIYFTGCFMYDPS